MHRLQANNRNIEMCVLWIGNVLRDRRTREITESERMIEIPSCQVLK